MTAAGYPAQANVPVRGQRYGEAKEQSDLQRSMPSPNVRADLAAEQPRPQPMVAPQPTAGGAGAPNPLQQPASPADLGAIAQAMRGQVGLFNRPTARPQEPVTAGLPVGPGPGPEALQMRRGSPVGEIMREVARASGDPFLAELAARSGL